MRCTRGVIMSRIPSCQVIRRIIVIIKLLACHDHHIWLPAKVNSTNYANITKMGPTNNALVTGDPACIRRFEVIILFSRVSCQCSTASAGQQIPAVGIHKTSPRRNVYLVADVWRVGIALSYQRHLVSVWRPTVPSHLRVVEVQQ